MQFETVLQARIYITALNDIDADNARVLEVVEGRPHEAAVFLLESIPAAQRCEVQAVALYMWDPFLIAVRQVLPEADIVHDKYHVSAHLNTAVDTVRKAEHKRLPVMTRSRAANFNGCALTATGAAARR